MQSGFGQPGVLFIALTSEDPEESYLEINPR